MTREADDGISVAMDPQDFISGFCISSEWEVGCLGCTTLVEKYAELSAAEKIQADCDMKATNIILQVQSFIYSTSTFISVSQESSNSTVPQVIQQVAYQSPQAPTQLMTKSLFVDSGLAIPVKENKEKDKIGSKPDKDGKCDEAGRSQKKGNTTRGQARVIKCYNCQGEGYMIRQCTQPKRPRNAAWFKEKAMLAEALESGQILDEEQLTEHLDAYDLNCDDVSNAKVVLMANLSSHGFDVISETEHLDAYDLNCDDVSNAKVVLMANLSSHGFDVILEASRVQIPENNLDNLSLTREEEDGIYVALDSQE
nr:hypothetical protein [Tanacetum cinerariifolium]